MALSDEHIRQILVRVAEDQLAITDPTVAHFFDFDPPPPKPHMVVRMHRWVVSPVHDDHTAIDVAKAAKAAVAELKGTSATLIGELIFGLPCLMPAPLWTDGAPLFDSVCIDGEHRFEVEGGNIVEASDCLARDLENAIDRLTFIDPDGSYDSDEHLTIYCTRPMAAKLTRASGKIRQKCTVMSIPDFESIGSWVLTGERSTCGLSICRPEIPINGVGTRIEIGAQFMTWIIDPTRAVRVDPPYI